MRRPDLGARHSERTRQQPAGRPGRFDPEAGRFWHARRVSRLRALWTDDPAHLVDRSDLLEIFMLGLAVPFGLLPASDPRLVRIAESILRLNSELKGDSHVLARTTYEPDRAASSSDQYEASSLATFWMVRFLIQLGRETGQGRHWTRALAMFDAVLGRLSHLGLVVRPSPRAGETANRAVYHGGTAWRLHSMLIETILDLAGLDYDAVDRRLRLRPVLPGSWPQTGLKQTFRCGTVTYLLQRPIGGRVHHLELKTRARSPGRPRRRIDLPGSQGTGPVASLVAHDRARHSTRALARSPGR